jgi:hypothetical protein
MDMFKKSVTEKSSQSQSLKLSECGSSESLQKGALGMVGNGSQKTWKPEQMEDSNVISVTASEFLSVLKADATIKTMRMKNGRGYIVRMLIPVNDGHAPLWAFYSKSLKAIKSLHHTVRDTLSSGQILFVDNYVPDTNLIHDVALCGSAGFITCHSWTQESWGKKAHVGYICGDGYRLSDEAEDILLVIIACCLGRVDSITARIYDEAKKVFGACQ